MVPRPQNEVPDRGTGTARVQHSSSTPARALQGRREASQEPRYQLSAAAMAFGSSGKRKRSEVATQHEDDQAGRDGSDNEAANVDKTAAGEEYITIEHEEEERADIEDYSGIEKTGEAIAEFLLNAIEEIGPANVLQVVTDNASNCKAAGKEIQKRSTCLLCGL
ncbi:hypothetical protein E2562_026354 [Oryza meyeriana var. granulata]|uniref:DUF659 domain-containing protein n=1 Tax=Oryza meyeriana var. granulata TaxID=110450 RepID=A0A6G1EZ26_9ORYZ|nr:hypothetical protein E2562_026354 [Oryza meyeriana var. granulata]